MRTKLFEDLPEQEIIDNLDAENIGTEESYKFLKPYTDDEIDKIQSDYIELSKKLEIKEQEKKALLEPIQADLKSLKDSTGILRKSLAEGGEIVNEQVWMIPDYEEKVVGLYDSRGMLVGTRPMSAKQRQLHINSHKHLKEA